MIHGVDASLIFLGMYQGGCPEAHEGTTAVRDAGMTALVLLAEEYQPDASRFPGVEVIHAPMDDSSVTPELWATANRAADAVVRYLGSHDQSVLVTCYEGRNRSGLVCALALHKLKYSAEDAIRKVKSGRGHHALANPYFVQALKDWERDNARQDR